LEPALIADITLASGSEMTVPTPILLSAGSMPSPKKHICVHICLHAHVGPKGMKPGPSRADSIIRAATQGWGYMFSLGEFLEMVSCLQ
jgi:hypothetical protein